MSTNSVGSGSAAPLLQGDALRNTGEAESAVSEGFLNAAVSCAESFASQNIQRQGTSEQGSITSEASETRDLIHDSISTPSIQDLYQQHTTQIRKLKNSVHSMGAVLGTAIITLTVAVVALALKLSAIAALLYIGSPIVATALLVALIAVIYAKRAPIANGIRYAATATANKVTQTFNNLKSRMLNLNIFRGSLRNANNYAKALQKEAKRRVQDYLKPIQKTANDAANRVELYQPMHDEDGSITGYVFADDLTTNEGSFNKYSLQDASERYLYNCRNAYNTVINQAEAPLLPPTDIPESAQDTEKERLTAEQERREDLNKYIAVEFESRIKILKTEPLERRIHHKLAIHQSDEAKKHDTNASNGDAASVSSGNSDEDSI